MELNIPYLVFEVNGKEYMIDAYFSKKLERVERVATLIKPANRDLPKTAENSLPILLKEDELEEFLKNLRIDDFIGKKLIIKNKKVYHMLY